VGRSLLLQEPEIAAGEAREAVRELAAAARAEMPRATVEAHYELRYRGQSFELEVTAGLDAAVAELRDLFEDAHERRYGYRDAEGRVELVNVRVSATEQARSDAGSSAVRGAPSSTATHWRPPCCAGAPFPAGGAGAPRSGSCRRQPP
jgi:N-methylhydantoinase A